MSYGELRKTSGGFCPNFEICMGCFVHVILLGVGCFVSLQKNMWWFLSTYNKMDVGGYVRGVFCPYTAHLAYNMFSWYKYLIVSLVFSHLGFLEWESFSDCAFS